MELASGPMSQINRPKITATTPKKRKAAFVFNGFPPILYNNGYSLMVSQWCASTHHEVP